MPPIEEVERNDEALYFEYTSSDRYNRPRVRSPIELDVRWENKRSFQTDSQGKRVPVDATVYADPDDNIVEGSLMWQGSEDEWYGGQLGTSSGSLGEETALMQVVSVQLIEDLKGRHTRCIVGLVYFRDTMPEVV